jgi:ribosomal 50S subunit-associated protein YjgA (DUF615 family)
LELENRTEPSLLGGVKVAIDGKVYDGTLNTKLEALRSRLLAQGGEAMKIETGENQHPDSKSKSNPLRARSKATMSAP